MGLEEVMAGEVVRGEVWKGIVGLCHRSGGPFGERVMAGIGCKYVG